MADIGWGALAPFEGYGRAGDHTDDYVLVDYKETLSDIYSSYMHASHAMLFARNDGVLWDLYSNRAAVLMQMRFDGLLGFPGGLVDPGETPIKGINRELSEEIGLDLNKFSVSDKNHVVSFFNEKKKLLLHFYGLEVSMQDFIEIEKNNLSAPEYGIETLGVIRPPLFTMGDGYRGLPAFLSNSFAGNSREEFLIGLEHFKILSKDEIKLALDSLKQFQEKNSNAVEVTTKTDAQNN